ncbi:hypothetical protein [Nocardia jejuensis]|uniref:hypothetical protein n=1 Tax=Nocardia jejuensis TaxID=328049 RepID=UPI0012FBFD8A|nr:hypothetical protein [Nocardia jejuensis]
MTRKAVSAKNNTTREISRIGVRSGAGRAFGRRAEFVAAAILAGLSLTVVAGWCAAPGDSGRAMGNPSAPAHGDGTLAYTAVTVPDASASGAVTATILGFMVFGAALIGLFFYSPRPLPGGPSPFEFPASQPARIRRRPRRSGAVVVYNLVRQACSAYSSMAPGAVLETVIRNSTLLLVFFNRSTMRSIA